MAEDYENVEYEFIGPGGSSKFVEGRLKENGRDEFRFEGKQIATSWLGKLGFSKVEKKIPGKIPQGLVTPAIPKLDANGNVIGEKRFILQDLDGNDFSYLNGKDLDKERELENLRKENEELRITLEDLKTRVLASRDRDSAIDQVNKIADEVEKIYKKRPYYRTKE